jgi:hypothetical protein
MKAYAIDHDGCYWLAHAPTAALAKGLLLAREGFTRPLRCRRWPELDRAWGDTELQAWGVPGLRDWECGNIIGTPAPFEQVRP